MESWYYESAHYYPACISQRKSKCFPHENDLATNIQLPLKIRSTYLIILKRKGLASALNSGKSNNSNGFCCKMLILKA